MASSVEDLYGNTITYKYNVTPYSWSGVFAFGEPQLTAITTSDGRNITINYATFNTLNVPLSGTETKSLITSIVSNGKTWKFSYDNVVDSCVDDYTGGNCAGASQILKTITRPDGKTWQFKYFMNNGTFGSPTAAKMNVAGATPVPIQLPSGAYIWTFKPGVTLVISEVTYPNRLVSNFGYNLFDNLKWTLYTPSPTTVDYIKPGANTNLKLTSKTYSGTGLSAPISWSYQYYLDGPSFTFELGPTKMRVSKYRHNPIYYPPTALGEVGTTPSLAIGSLDDGLLLESAVLPLPPAGSLPTYPAAPPPAAPPVPEPIAPPVVSSVGVLAAYLSNQPFTIDFSDTSTLPIVWAQCSLNGAAYVPCASLDSFSTAGLTPGTYTLTIETEDAFGNWSAPKKISFTVAPQGSCVLGGDIIASGSSVTAYTAMNVPYGSTCVSQKRTCTKGVLSGTYPYTYCNVAAAASCTLDGDTIASGSSVTAYAASTVPYGSTCSSQTRKCNNGTLSGTYAYASCSVTPPAACTFNSKSIPSGSSVTAYAASTVPYGSTCSSQMRTCTNGTLSGTYAYASCTVDAPPKACPWNGGSIASGTSVTGYKKASTPPCTACSTVAETVTCTNGTLSPAGAYPNCAEKTGTCP